jgi:site-specific DNA-methyltransferase (adenine-specific)
MNQQINKIYKKLKKEKFPLKIIQRGNSEHILVQGDCLDVMRYIPDRSIDLIITDPPYNKGLDYGKNFNDNRPLPEYYSWLKRRLEEIPRILKQTGSFYLISYPEINARLLPFLEDTLGLNFKRWITWHYPTNIGHSNKNFTRSQRSILFFTKSNNYIFNRENLIQHYKNPTASVIRKRLAAGYKGRTSYDLLRFLDLLELQKGLIDVLDIDLLKNNSKDRIRNLKGKFRPLSKGELKKRDHPCQLPLALLKILVKVSSNNGAIIFDPFAGTFTTSIAAAELERNSIGVEINKQYINFGLKRFKL